MTTNHSHNLPFCPAKSFGWNQGTNGRSMAVQKFQFVFGKIKRTGFSSTHSNLNNNCLSCACHAWRQAAQLTCADQRCTEFDVTELASHSLVEILSLHADQCSSMQTAEGWNYSGNLRCLNAGKPYFCAAVCALDR